MKDNFWKKLLDEGSEWAFQAIKESLVEIKSVLESFARILFYHFNSSNHFFKE
jgi:hypothetical protein